MARLGISSIISMYEYSVCKFEHFLVTNAAGSLNSRLSVGTSTLRFTQLYISDIFISSGGQ